LGFLKKDPRALKRSWILKMFIIQCRYGPSSKDPGFWPTFLLNFLPMHLRII
jgi:hypothetical protein